jgi:dihydroneopterin aldolase
LYNFSEKDMTSIIEIEGMEFYAYHGHYKEERIVGNKFVLDIYLETDTSKAELTDNIDDALNYQTVYEIIKEQMGEKSYLLEHIANRILNAIYAKFENKIISSKLKVSKINPPMGGQIEKVSVTLRR